jgi:hypothetical protein
VVVLGDVTKSLFFGHSQHFNDMNDFVIDGVYQVETDRLSRKPEQVLDLHPRVLENLSKLNPLLWVGY